MAKNLGKLLLDLYLAGEICFESVVILTVILSTFNVLHSHTYLPFTYPRPANTPKFHPPWCLNCWHAHLELSTLMSRPTYRRCYRVHPSSPAHLASVPRTPSPPPVSSPSPARPPSSQRLCKNNQSKLSRVFSTYI